MKVLLDKKESLPKEFVGFPDTVHLRSRVKKKSAFSREDGVLRISDGSSNTFYQTEASSKGCLPIDDKNPKEPCNGGDTSPIRPKRRVMDQRPARRGDQRRVRCQCKFESRGRGRAAAVRWELRKKVWN